MKLPKPRNTTVFLVILALVAGVTGYVGTGLLISMQRQVPKKQTASTLSIPTSDAKQSLPAAQQIPTAINIPKIHKNLPIKSASIRGNDWEMFGDAVAWLSTSAVPGEGNVILYAHDWTNLWADLYLLKPGDTIDVEQNNLWKTYTVTESRDVDQHDIQSVLSNENRLTLYTCEGSFDQKRRVVYADPIK